MSATVQNIPGKQTHKSEPWDTLTAHNCPQPVMSNGLWCATTRRTERKEGRARRRAPNFQHSKHMEFGGSAMTAPMTCAADGKTAKVQRGTFKNGSSSKGSFMYFSRRYLGEHRWYIISKTIDEMHPTAAETDAYISARRAGHGCVGLPMNSSCAKEGMYNFRRTKTRNQCSNVPPAELQICSSETKCVPARRNFR